jgi:VacB/RNase II family 3'-5' exoribonuclease
MVAHRVAGAPLDFAALRAELVVTGDFASDVQAQAREAARAVELPDEDATDIPFVTVDPPGSRDLDQAVHIAREGDGYLVSYAIADVAAFVRPDSAVDVEARRRGETLYFPDVRVPLHPPVLSEDAASLLPGQLRPAVLWRITLDGGGDVRATDVRRARVRSRAQLDYAGVQDAFERSAVPDAIALLRDVGERRLALARKRHAINLDLPEQEVEHGRSGWRLAVREPLPVEDYNAEISLLTGMCAAAIMLEHRHGIVRTLAPPDPGAVRALRRAALALGVAWPSSAAPGDVLARLDRGNPHHVALLEHATTLLRGAGYIHFVDTVPAHHTHAGIGAPYAHVTAPLRRLVDRYASELCVALYAGATPPSWVDEQLALLPELMAQADRRAHEIDRAVIDATEAWLLRDRIGETFDATIIDANEHSATITLDEPAVRARCTGDHLTVGDRIRARLVQADVATRTVSFASSGALRQ